MKFENLRVRDVRAVVRYRPSVRRWQSIRRQDHFVGIQLSGSARHRFPDRSFVLSENCVYFFNRREDYDVEVSEAGEAISVHFTTYEEIETPSFCIPVEHPEQILALLQKAELLKGEEERRDLLLLSTLYQLCDAVAAVREKSYSRRDERVLAARSYMDRHYAASDCLAGAVAVSQLSARRFNDRFKQSFLTTPNRYLTLRRIEEAKTLLELQSLSVGEVAERCGFSDVYYFSKVFRRLTGTSPSRWKQPSPD